MLYAKFNSRMQEILFAAKMEAERACQDQKTYYPIIAAQKDKTVKVAGEPGAIMALIGALANMGESSLVRVWEDKKKVVTELQPSWTQLSFLDLHLENS